MTLVQLHARVWGQPTNTWSNYCISDSVCRDRRFTCHGEYPSAFVPTRYIRAGVFSLSDGSDDWELINVIVV